MWQFCLNMQRLFSKKSYQFDFWQWIQQEFGRCHLAEEAAEWKFWRLVAILDEHSFDSFGIPPDPQHGNESVGGRSASSLSKSQQPPQTWLAEQQVENTSRRLYPNLSSLSEFHLQGNCLRIVCVLSLLFPVFAFKTAPIFSSFLYFVFRWNLWGSKRGRCSIPCGTWEAQGVVGAVFLVELVGLKGW